MLVLVLVEAMGFAYVLAGWMNMDASTNDRHLLAAATALLLAVASAHSWLKWPDTPCITTA